MVAKDKREPEGSLFHAQLDSFDTSLLRYNSSMKKTKIKTGGFTLIEILVAIAIIGILSMVIFASINQVRANARDKERLSNLKQMQAAIEIYGNANGRYPAAGCGRVTSWTGKGSSFGSCTVYIDGIEDLMSPLPIDTTTTVNGYLYRTNTSGTAYKLMSFNVLENQSVDGASEYARYRTGDSCSSTMTGSALKTLAVYKGAEAACW